MSSPVRPSVYGVYVLLVILTAPVLPPAHAQSEADDLSGVRVRLNHQSVLRSAQLEVEDGPLRVRLPSGGSVMRLNAGETSTLGLRQNEVSIRHGEKGLYATRLHLQPSQDDATWTLSFENREDRTYTGGLYVAPASQPQSSLLVVNDVPIEDYVASVVASEYGLDDTEGAKAMAVVARTYGLFTSEKFGGAYDKADGTASQVYEGVGAVTKDSKQAARATDGEVLTYDGNLIQAVYFSSSGGHTADNEAVWKAKKPIPYLRGKKDPYDTGSPHHNWTTTMRRQAVLRALTRHRGTSVEGFTINDRSPDGRVKSVNVLQSNGGRHAMSANAFRLLVNREVDGASLKSTFFDARRRGSEYVFDGHGFGHGVGLSQWGAHAMAEQGKSYREILRFYYTGVEIEKIGGVEFDPVDAPVAKEPAVTRSDTTDRRIGW